MTTEHLTANDGTRLALHRVGDDAGAPVLLVPGAFSDNRFFTHPGILVSRAAREEVWPVVLDWIASVTAEPARTILLRSTSYGGLSSRQRRPC